MSRTFSLPLDGDVDTLSVSDTKLNDTVDALKTTHVGSGDLSSPIEGQIWVDSGSNLLRARRSADTVTLGKWEPQLGHVAADGTIPLTTTWDVGAQRLTNLAAPSATTDATRKSYVDGFFDDTTGHDHSGMDGEGPILDAAVALTNVGAAVDSSMVFKMVSNGAGVSKLSTTLPSSTGSWTSIDISSDTGSDTAAIALLRMGLRYNNSSNIPNYRASLSFRRNGTVDEINYVDSNPFGLYQVASNSRDYQSEGLAAIAVDASEIFQYRIIIANGGFSPTNSLVFVRLIGYWY